MSQDRDSFKLWLQTTYPSLEKSETERLIAFGKLVRDSADRLGLVGRGDWDRIYTRHIQESLAPVLLDLLKPRARVLDVGSGGGFPAIPIAILREDLALTLTEPRKKKAAFLEGLAVRLGLKNVVVLAEPVEETPRVQKAPPWDCVLSRAVRWNRGMLRAVEKVVVAEGPIIRFGSPSLTTSGVKILELNEERAIQVWPRAAWRDLPEAI